MSTPYPFGDEIEIGRVWLDTQKIGIREYVSGEFMRANLKLRKEIENDVINRMVYEIETRVRSHNLPPEQIEESRTMACDAPATWWHHWKHDVAAKHWALHWIVRRWPVRFAPIRHKLTVKLDLRRFRVYPDAPDIGHARGFAISFVNHTRSVTARWDETGDKP